MTGRSPSRLERLGLDAIIDHGGIGVVVVQAVAGGWPKLPAVADGVLRLGLHREGALPCGDLDWFDALLSVDPHAQRPWVGLCGDTIDTAVAQVQEMVARQPLAVAVLAQILRMTLALPLDHALILESLGYSTLLASGGFRRWREQTPRRLRLNEPARRVVLERKEAALQVRLSRPESRNAFDAAMRDELVAALEFALDDPERSPVLLNGDGPCFSAGGDLGEFGRAADSGVAHAVRVLQSPARLVHRLGARLTVQVHGACIGAGIEVAAAATHIVARRDTYCRLPELSMGLIPGAGGTATISRRIGRQRTCYMAITGVDIDADTALRWGLIDTSD
jgi:hypothetical protein